MARRFSFEQLESRMMMRATPMLSVDCYLANTASQLNPMIPEAFISLYSRGAPVTGTVTAKLADPTGAVIETETFTFAAQGVTYTYYATIPTVSGKYTWTASYAGDTHNKPATKSASITITVPTLPPPPPPPPSSKPFGYQTFYESSPDPNSPSQLNSTQAYVRYDWSDVETAPGVYNFAPIDADYNAAKAAGQQFNFRIMPFEDGNLGPTGLKSLPGYSFNFGGATTWQPNLDSPAVQADLDMLLAALGSRYAANTATVDVGWYGPYGEWANYNESPTPPLPNLATWNWLIAETKKYFPSSIVVTQAVVDYEWGTSGYLERCDVARMLAAHGLVGPRRYLGHDRRRGSPENDASLAVLDEHLHDRRAVRHEFMERLGLAIGGFVCRERADGHVFDEGQRHSAQRNVAARSTAQLRDGLVMANIDLAGRL